MFEGIISSLITKYLCKYCDNINPKQIQLSIFRGNVNLSEVILKESSFTSDSFPIKMAFGRINHIEIQLPQLIHILSKPITINIENILLILGMIIYTIL